MADSDVLVQIRADVSDINMKLTDIKGHIGKVTDETKRLHDQSSGFLSKIKADWVAVSVGIFAVFQVLQKGWALAENAAKFEEMEAGLQGLAGQYGMTAEAAIQMAKAAVGGQLSMMEAGKLAARAFALGFNPDQVKEFLIVSERLTDVMGGEIPDAFAAMEKAAATGRSRGLVQYGINVDLKKSLEDYATAHGIATESISATMAMQIRATAVMEATKRVTDLMGESTESTADKMNKLRATIADIQLTMGQFSLRAGAALIGTMMGISAAAWAVVTGFLKVGEGIAWLISVIPGAEKADKDFYESTKANADAAWKTSQEMAQKGSDALKAAFAEKKLIAAATRKLLADDTEKPKESKDAKAAREAWAAIARGLEAEIEKDSGLDAFEKSLVDLDKKVSDLLEKASKLPTASEQKSAKGLIEKFREAEIGRASSEAATKYLEEGLKVDKAWEDFFKKRQAAREAEINNQLTSLDLAEKEGAYHIDTLETRKRLLTELTQIQENWLKTIDPADRTAWNTQIAAINQTKQKVADFHLEMRPVFAGLKKYAEEAQNVWKNTGKAIEGVFSRLTDALTDFVMTGKMNFEDFANSVIRDMVRIMIQAQVTGPLAAAAGSGLSGFFGSLFGSGGSAGASSQLTASGIGITPSIGAGTPFTVAPGFHSGGMAKEPSFFRIIPNPDLLPRYHKGLGPGERLSVTTDDESTMTPGQRKDFFQMARALGSGNQSPQSIRVEIHNSAQPSQVSKSQASVNGQEIVVSLWLDALNRNAYGLRDALGG